MMALNQKVNGKIPERNDGNMPQAKQVFYQCQAVILGPDKGGITPFSIGNISFDKNRASSFVKGVEKKGFDYIKRNYPILCEQPAL
jgi:hypothetical protein